MKPSQVKNDLLSISLRKKFIQVLKMYVIAAKQIYIKIA